MVEVEIVIIVHVGLDGVQVDVDVVELPHEEVAGGHALSARNGVALVRRRPDQLEALLRHLQVLPIAGGLSQGRVYDSLDDVFLGSGGVQIVDCGQTEHSEVK